jgi:hypothetical protein
LQEPGIQQVAVLLNQAGIGAGVRQKALESTMKAHSLSPTRLKLSATVLPAVLSGGRFPLERKVLRDHALIALPRIAALPVDESVKQLLCKEFMFMADPSEAALPKFSINVYTFVAMARLVFLVRFPDGHYHLEVSGFPKTWLAKVSLRLLPLTLRFLLLEAGGLNPWFVSHMRGTGAGNLFLVESEFRKSFFPYGPRAGKATAHPSGHGAVLVAFSPNASHQPASRLSNRIFVEAGGIVTTLDPPARKTVSQRAPNNALSSIVPASTSPAVAWPRVAGSRRLRGPGSTMNWKGSSRSNRTC